MSFRPNPLNPKSLARLPRLLRAAALAGVAAAPVALFHGPVEAHSVSHRIERVEAVVVSLDFGTGQPMRDAPYRVYGPEPGPPFSVGRTDSRGRLAFRPDRPGTWRVTVSSADGHGASLRVEVDDEMRAASQSSADASGWPMVLAGLGYIAGFAGLAALWKARR